MKIWLAALGLITSLAIAPIASATTLMNFSGSGVWGSTAPTSAYSAPLDTWSFSFDLPSPIAGNPTTEATNFSYTLNGTAVNGAPSSITFFDSASLGLFDINFSNISVSLFSASKTDVGSSLTLLPGIYTAFITLNDGTANGNGTIGIQPIPEPSSWVLLATALVMGGGLLYYRKTSAATTL